MKLPRIDPILLKKRKEPFDSPEYLFDLKNDGFRAVLYYEALVRPDGKSACELWSKVNNRLSLRPLEKELAESLAARRGRQAVKSLILDGEAVSLGVGGWQSFSNLMKRVGELVYIAFDIMWLDGRDLRQLPLVERRRILSRVVKPTNKGCLRHTFSVTGDGIAFFQSVCQNDLEGIVGKRLDSTYNQWAGWTKIKNPDYSQNKGRTEFFLRTKARSRSV